MAAWTNIGLTDDAATLLTTQVVDDTVATGHLGWRESIEPKTWVRNREEGLSIVAAARTRVPVGVDLVVLLDTEGGWIDAFQMEPGTPLPEIIEVCASRMVPGAAILVVSNRTGEVPTDRPDDELVWEEIAGIAASYGVTLLDWFVFSGPWSFSVTEFSPSGDGWANFGP